MKAINIKWDTDGDLDLLITLPTEIIIPDEVAKEGNDAISDYISDWTGYCHFGFDLVESEECVECVDCDIALVEHPLGQGLTYEEVLNLCSWLDGPVIPLEITENNISALGFYRAGINAEPGKDLVAMKNKLASALSDYRLRDFDGNYEAGGLRALMAIGDVIATSKSYVFVSYNDEDAFGAMDVRLFSSRKAARSYLAFSAKQIWGEHLERLDFDPEEDSWGPDYVSAREGGGIRFLKIQGLLPEVVDYNCVLPDIPDHSTKN